MLFVAASFLVWNPIDSLESVTRIVTSDDTITSDGRIQLWSVAWKMWQEHPVLGVGIGQYRAVADQYIFGGVGNIAHNTYLSFLAETGLVGFVVFISLPLAIFVRVLRSKRDGNTFAPLLALGLAAVAVQAFTLNLENSRALWALLGIGAALCDLAARSETHDPSSSGRE
jgi:O-antigen ligase